jgi:uncharacterized protein
MYACAYWGRLWSLSGTSARHRRTWRKHRVDFADAATILEDEPAVTVAEDDPEEERFVTMGMDAVGRVLVVVYMIRGQRIRIISARRATKHERMEYRQGL